jgi:hypothetical protein
MSMIFEFKEMENAKAFVSELKKRFGLDGQVFDDAKAAAQAADLFPWVQYPPVAHIDRVWADSDAEATEIKHRFGLTARQIEAWRKDTSNLQIAVTCAAESKVRKLAVVFGGEFIGT